MKKTNALGELLEGFVNAISHPRGRTLNLMANASVTVPQIVLLNFALNIPESTPSSLATLMKISLPSASQMVERLVKLGFARRAEDPRDRRRKTIEVTPKAKTFLARLKAVRSAEYATSTATLSPATQELLTEAISQVLSELAELSE